jgi:hypothetical protein
MKNAISSIVPDAVKPMIVKAVDPLSGKITDTFQEVMNTGYSNMYIAAGIIALAGLLLSLLLKNKQVKA